MSDEDFQQQADANQQAAQDEFNQATDDAKEILDDANATLETEEGEPAPAETPPIETEPATEGETTPEPEPEYKPDYKYQVMGEEYEIDEKLRGLIKSEEDERYVKNLLLRSRGIDHVLDAREQLNEKHKKLEEDYKKTQDDLLKHQRAIDELKYHRKTGNYSTLFEKVGLSEQDVLSYAEQVQQYQLASPEERAAMDRQRQAQESNFKNYNESQELRDKVSRLEEQIQQNKQAEENRQKEAQLQAQAALLQDINSQIGSDKELKTFVDDYNKKSGIPDKFQRDVFNNGYYLQSQMLPGQGWPTAKQTVDYTLNMLNFKRGSGSKTPEAPKKTIPTIKGSNQRFILKKPVTTLAEQEKAIAALEEQASNQDFENSLV